MIWQDSLRGQMKLLGFNGVDMIAHVDDFCGRLLE